MAAGAGGRRFVPRLVVPAAPPSARLTEPHEAAAPPPSAP